MSFDFIPDDGGTPTPKDASNTEGEPSPRREPIEMLLIGSPCAATDQDDDSQPV